MKLHYIFPIVLSVLAALPVFAPIAQERSAVGSVDIQMTWTALNSLVQSSVAKSDMVNSRVDQIVVCNRKAMLYAPGNGADTDGCIANSGITTLTQSLATQTQSINSKLSSINYCASLGQVWNSSTNQCKKTTGGLTSCTLQSASRRSGSCGTSDPGIPSGAIAVDTTEVSCRGGDYSGMVTLYVWLVCS